MAREFFKVEGLKELDEALKELPRATARNVLLRTLRIEAKPIADMAAQLAPDDPKTGGERDLKTNILVRSVSARSRKSNVEVAVGPSSKAFHGFFQEFGTAHHAPHAFLRPAWDGNVMRVLDGIKNTLANEIEKARQRLARKAAREAAKLKSGA